MTLMGMLGTMLLLLLVRLLLLQLAVIPFHCARHGSNQSQDMELFWAQEKPLPWAQ